MQNLPADKKGSLAVVILTFNEEVNIGAAIASVRGWANEVLVLDSFSTDKTAQIAEEHGCRVERNRFSDYGSQRNFAIENLGIDSEWIFFLDADETLTPALREEISIKLASSPSENGFYLRFRMMWMGKWIRRGYYPTWILRLFRRQFGKCESRSVNEHLAIEGAAGYLDNDLIHDDRKGLSSWLAKHDRYARREAEEMLRKRDSSRAESVSFLSKIATMTNSQAMRKRWIREEVWDRLPLLIRPFAYFGYRYVIRGGMLDGKEAFTFHFLHGLWFPMLVDIHALELQRNKVEP